MKGVYHDLSALEEELEGMGPIARNIDIVKKQIYEIKSFRDALDHKKNDIGEVAQDCKEIIDQRYTSDIKSCKDQVRNCSLSLCNLSLNVCCDLLLYTRLTT